MGEIYKRIEDLCKSSKINITVMCKEAGVPRSALSDYKAGRIKTLSTDKLSKIAAYFNVSVDYLLGNTDQKEKAPAKAEADDVTFDDFTYAFHNEAKDLSAEEKNALLEMAKALKRAKEGK